MIQVCKQLVIVNYCINKKVDTGFTEHYLSSHFVSLSFQNMKVASVRNCIFFVLIEKKLDLCLTLTGARRGSPLKQGDRKGGQKNIAR